MISLPKSGATVSSSVSIFRMSRRTWSWRLQVNSAISNHDIPGMPLRVVGLIAPAFEMLSKVVAVVLVMSIIFSFL